MTEERVKEVMTADEAAAFLGFNPYTVREKARAGEIPGRKVGKEWRFSRSALLDWLKDGEPSRRHGPVVVVAENPGGDGWTATVEGRPDLRGVGQTQDEAVRDVMVELELASRAKKYRLELPVDAREPKER